MKKDSPKSGTVADISIRNGILIYVYKPNTKLTLDIAEKAINQRLAFQKDKSYPILCDVRGLVTSEKIARDYLAREGSVLIKAVGFLAPDHLSQFIINFYLESTINKIPSKAFRHEFSALQFLDIYR